MTSAVATTRSAAITTVMAAGLSRIRFRIPTAFMEDDKSYVPREEFPYLYELAEQAARKVPWMPPTS